MTGLVGVTFLVEITQFVPSQWGGFPRFVWRPVQHTVRLLNQVREAVVRVGGQLWEIARSVSRMLNGATPPLTRMQTRSQAEFVFGPVTWSVASAVAYTRPGDTIPE